MSELDERTRRIGHNEALFRQVNERIEEIKDGIAALTGAFDIVCECGNLSCAEQITLTPEAYERARSSPMRFVVKPGHEPEDLEVVIDGGAAYHVVEKAPADARKIAEQTDTRN